MDKKEGGDTRLIVAGIGIMVAVSGSLFLCETALRGKCPSTPSHIAYTAFAPENLSERWRRVFYKSVKPNRRQIDNTSFLAALTDAPFEIDAACSRRYRVSTGEA